MIYEQYQCDVYTAVCLRHEVTLTFQLDLGLKLDSVL